VFFCEIQAKPKSSKKQQQVDFVCKLHGFPLTTGS